MSSSIKALLNLKIFFALFSKQQILISLAIGFVAWLFAGTEVGDALAVIAYFLFLFIFLRVATIIHESGHLVAGLLVGAKPERMVLGVGHEVARIKFEHFKLIINSKPVGGYVIAPVISTRFKRLRLAFFYLGGVFANASAAMLGYYLFVTQSSIGTTDLSSMFIIANAGGLLNLIPFYTRSYGPRIGTDGMQLITLPFKKSSELDQSTLKTVLDSNDLLESKRYSEAVVYIKQELEKHPGELLLQFNLATALFKVGEVEESMEVVTLLEKNTSEKTFKPYVGYVMNLKACIFLEQEKIDEAHLYAERAYKTLSRVHAVIGTYGSTLILRGDLDNGIKVLAPLVDFRYPNSNTLTASMFLMVANFQKNNFKLSNKFRNFVSKHLNLLDRDEKLLYERCLSKVEDATTIRATQ